MSVSMPTAHEPSDSPKLHLLNLPLEIRQEIYYYALVCPQFTPWPRFAPVFISWDAFWRKYYRERGEPRYWGTERMTPLLLVNKQTRLEAEEVLYGSGRFVFVWPHYSCSCSVSMFLSKRSQRARESIKSIKVNITERFEHGDETQKFWEQRQQALHETFLKELAGLRSVTLKVDFIGGPDEDEQRRAVDAIVRIAGMYRGIDEITLLPPDMMHFEERKEMFEQAAARVERKQWIEDKQLDVNYVCCSEWEMAKHQAEIL